MVGKETAYWPLASTLYIEFSLKGSWGMLSALGPGAASEFNCRVCRVPDAVPLAAPEVPAPRSDDAPLVAAPPNTFLGAGSILERLEPFEDFCFFFRLLLASSSAAAARAALLIGTFHRTFRPSAPCDGAGSEPSVDTLELPTLDGGGSFENREPELRLTAGGLGALVSSSLEPPSDA